MTDKKKYVAATPGMGSYSDWLNLWEVEELCRIARAEGLPDESEFRIEYEKNFLVNRYIVQHNPSRRTVAQVAERRTPVEQAIESHGKRNVYLGFVRSGDVRKPVTVLIEVQDVGTNTTIASLPLDEHQFALLLSGQVVQAKDDV